MALALALVSISALLLFGRSVRGGLAGPLSTTIAVLQWIAAPAAVWLMAMYVGWWTVALFVGLSLVAGFVVNRENVAAWVNLQPITGLAGLLGAAGGWAVRLLSH